MGLGFRNIWKFECYKPNGKLQWKEEISNIVVNEGLINILSVMFLNASQSYPWYVLLFDSASTPTENWTYASINDEFTEFVGYDDLFRPVWQPTSPVIPTIADSVTFTASLAVSATLYGAALVNHPVKDDSVEPTGLMWCASTFATSRPFSETEVLQVSYTINATNA